MKVWIPGHRYTLDIISHDSSPMMGGAPLNFVFRKKFNPDSYEKDQHGVNNQEVLRVLIDRMKFLNEQNQC